MFMSSMGLDIVLEKVIKDLKFKIDISIFMNN